MVVRGQLNFKAVTVSLAVLGMVLTEMLREVAVSCSLMDMVNIFQTNQSVFILESFPPVKPKKYCLKTLLLNHTSDLTLVALGPATFSSAASMQAISGSLLPPKCHNAHSPH